MRHRRFLTNILEKLFQVYLSQTVTEKSHLIPEGVKKH